MKNKDTKDLVMKDFEAYPDVAADLLNVFLHEGQQRVRQENLLAAPTETLYQGQEKGIKEEEDIKVCELFDQYERRGQQKEFERSIERMILENLEEHRTEETIIGKLVRWFSLTKEQAKMYYDKYARAVV